MPFISFLSQLQRAVGQFAANHSGQQIQLLIQHNKVCTLALFKRADVIKPQLLCGDLAHGGDGMLNGHTVADKVFQLFQQSGGGACDGAVH